MKNTRSLMTCCLTMILLLNSCKNVDVMEDERQIRELWKKASDYLCAGDWKNYSKCWDHSSTIQVMHPDQGQWLTGWETIGGKYEAMLNSGMRCSPSKNELTLNISKSGEMAWGTVDCVIQFNDSTKTRIHFWETAVFEKIDRQWKMVSGMASVPKNIKEP